MRIRRNLLSLPLLPLKAHPHRLKLHPQDLLRKLVDTTTKLETDEVMVGFSQQE